MSVGPTLPTYQRRARGHAPAPDLAQRKAASHARHGARLLALPNVTASSYDCRTLGIVPPVRDQGQCGSCWDFSGSGVATMALIAAGYGPADGSFNLSEQNVMDCNSTGACMGDDNTTVLQIAETVGILTDAQYGPYEGSRRSCKVVSNPQPYKIGSWGFCDGTGNGVTATQLIKNCMAAYGPIGVGIAADDAFENNPAGTVFLGSGSRDIDHDVILVGWQDDASIPSGGYWILRNSWGTDWCEQGYIRIAYGANNVGSEAVWASAVPLGPIPVPPTSIAA